jgi:hypothetical protein
MRHRESDPLVMFGSMMLFSMLIVGIVIGVAVARLWK